MILSVFILFLSFTSETVVIVEIKVIEDEIF